MQLLSQNTLILLEPRDRGEKQNEQLQNTKDVPPKHRQGLLKVEVLAQRAANGQAQLQLPSGQIITADVPENIPPGSQLLLQMKGDQPPEILRVLLPKTPEQPAQIRPSSTPSVLLDIAKNAMAKEGQTIKFTAPRVNMSGPQNSIFMPSPGMSVMGRTLTPPQSGGQTLNLTNGHQLTLLLPPVFEVNSEVVLKIGQNQTAVIDKLRLPVPQLPQATLSDAPELTNETRGSFPRQVVIEGTGKLTTEGRVLLPTPIKLKPQSPIPTTLLRNTSPQLVTVQQFQPNSVTIGLQNGVLLTFDIPEQTLQQLGFQSTLSSGQNSNSQGVQQMAIRFTDSGVLEVLSTVSARAPQSVAGRNPEHQSQQDAAARQAPQTGAQPSGQQGSISAKTPELSVGQIATGTVVEQRPGGEVILQFGKDVRTPVIAQRMLPVGSHISVHIMPDGHAEILDIVMPKGSDRSNALLRFSLSWDTLAQAMSNLEDSNPEGAEKLKSVLPEANEKLLPKLLQLSHSITTQNMRSFFGDDVLNMLRALGLDGMLQSDAAQLNNLHQKPDAPDGWRALMFPYLDDQNQTLQQGSFFWRKHKKKNPEDGDSLRFVLNVKMSELGPIQLDGLMQGKDVMHIKIRMTQGISEAEHKGLEELVQNSLSAVGLRGTLQIETVSFFETDPLHDMLAPITDDAPEHQLNVEA